ncbi:MAG: type I-E CRISPR-associated protein Cse2/CasB [Sulfobacillus acidophilus]|uniref:Type I-E CRISPR-associated protein Cse2/CasB n=1 Tax=Sulfobacillus acidophilus TaxID=53633 RepID=A0A2T2WE04_9FIRM|nr:MAG: type I-E CRISPR-associated protein Cse2/CasB [Sulfobacillus acidophilus]
MSESSPNREESLSRTVARLAGFIASSGLSNGDRAALKRMHFGQPPPLAFYKLALRYLPSDWDVDTIRKDWITIVSGMALMSPHIHRPDQSTGRILAEVRFSEARIERLLASRDDLRRTLVLRMTRYLAAKLVAVNWMDIAGLLLTRDPDRLEQLHRRIARDFYSHQIP